MSCGESRLEVDSIDEGAYGGSCGVEIVSLGTLLPWLDP